MHGFHATPIEDNLDPSLAESLPCARPTDNPSLIPEENGTVPS